jgi:exosortase
MNNEDTKISGNTFGKDQTGNIAIYCIFWGMIAAIFYPLFSILYRQNWDTLGYTHAFFILPVSIGLAYWKREELVGAFHATQNRFGIINLAVFAIGIAIYLFGWHQNYAFISTLALIPTLYGFIGYVYGGPVQRALLFPVLYLLLLVPPPIALLDRATLPLRHISAVGVEQVFRLFHVPIQREGLIYVVRGQQMVIDAACSGLRSLVTMFSLVLPYIYIIRCGLSKKIVLVSSVIPLVLLGNIVRIITITLLGLYFGQKVAQGFMHYFSGALVFLFIVLGFLLTERIWGKVTGEKKADNEGEIEWFE